MAFEFRLPDIGEGVIEGEVIRWMVKEGEDVREDQPMVEVMTDKATVEIPSPKSGRVTKISAPEGKMCAVGQVMVTIDTDGSSAGAGAAAKGASASSNGVPTLADEERENNTQRLPRSVDGGASAPASATSGTGSGGGSVGNGKALATPATRKLARELGVDIGRVPPTGDGGRVTRDDVLRASGQSSGAVMHSHQKAPAGTASAQSPVAGEMMQTHQTQHTPAPSPIAAPGDERVPFRGVRKKIAENMARSRRTAAHFTYVEECDVTELVALRERARKKLEERGVKLTFLPFIIKAVVAGLKKFPIVNSTLDEERGEIVLRKQYNIGVAAASEAGLIVPVVKDCDRKSLFEIARELQELGEKGKQGKATREELTGSTFTISSLGALGGVLATPIINFPEVAILGVHKIKPTPVVREGQIVIREMTNFSVSLDHRVVDGYEGAMFLQHVIGLLSDPTMMFLDLV